MIDLEINKVNREETVIKCEQKKEKDNRTKFIVLTAYPTVDWTVEHV